MRKTLKKRRLDFAVNLDGVDITEIPVQTEDLIGITVDQVPIPGMVSLYEEDIARTASGYTLEEWYAASPFDRAREVAINRIKKAVEYQNALAERRKIRSKS